MAAPSTKKQKRQSRRAAPPPAVAPAAAAPPPTRRRLPPLAALLLAAAAVLALVAWMRFTAPLPWSYDEYYHLGLAREMRSDLRLESFWWTPFSTLYDSFVDSTPLFHLLLMPLATLPLELASSLGVVLGQLFVVGSFAWAFASLRVPRAWWFLLAVPAMGTMLLQRLEMLRPHVWLIGFSVLVIVLLVQRRWKTLLAVCAVFGLTHTGGWIAIPMAVLWSLSGLLVRDPEDDPASRSGSWRARAPWHPVAAAAGGWLLGQLVHPQLPENFRLFFISNFVIPFQAGTASGDASLKTMLGSELFPPEPWILRGQWPAYVVAALVVFLLVRHPSLRTRATLTAALPALAFLFVGSVRIRRFLELGEPLVLLALALIAREAVRRGLPRPRPGQRKALAVVTGLALLWTVGAVRMAGDGRVSAPLGMARWLGEHGRRGERVFTAQWADSSPLFYAAPQLQSLVALDPTVFYTKDRQAFERYVTIALGRDPVPAKSIRDIFGARWVTLWRQPVFEPLARQLWQKPGVTIVYQDPDYWVVDLGGGPPAGGTPSPSGRGSPDQPLP